MKKVVTEISRNILFFAMVALCFTSCKESQVSITYTLECSEAFLQYAMPQVVYKSNNGNGTLITISDNEWTESSTTVVRINGVDKPLKKWTKTITYKDFSVVDDEMIVTYTPKANAESVEFQGYLLTINEHNLSAKVELEDEDGNTYVHSTHPLSIKSESYSSLIDYINKQHDYRGFHIVCNGTIQEKENSK